MLIQNEEIETILQILENGKIQHRENNHNKQLEGKSFQLFVNTVTKMLTHKWHIKVKLFIKLGFCEEFLALVDYGADIYCVQERLIPTVYFEKTHQGAMSANSKSLAIDFKISNIHICNQNICYKTSLLLVRDMNKRSS